MVLTRMLVNESIPRAVKQWQSEDECRYVSTWATLALQVYRTTAGFEHTDQTHLFVTSVTNVLEVMRARLAAGQPVHEPPRWVDEPMSPLAPGSVSLRAWTFASEPVTPMIELLSSMVHVLEWSLEQQQPDCGAHFQLPWVKCLVRCYEAAGTLNRSDLGRPPRQAIPLTTDPRMWPIFQRILHLLNACIVRELITAENVRADFGRLISLTGRPEVQSLNVPLEVPFRSPTGTNRSDVISVRLVQTYYLERNEMKYSSSRPHAPCPLGRQTRIHRACLHPYMKILWWHTIRQVQTHLQTPLAW